MNGSYRIIFFNGYYFVQKNKRKILLSWWSGLNHYRWSTISGGYRNVGDARQRISDLKRNGEVVQDEF